MNLENIKNLSRIEKKNLLQRCVKLQEEVGELAQEILISQNAPGFAHKKAGCDGISGECVDIILVALSIYFAVDNDVDGLCKKIDIKCQKWQEKQI